MKHSEKYDWFDALLLYFLIYGEEAGLDDVTVIKKFINNTIDYQAKGIIIGDNIAKTIAQGREVLTLDPFPDEWIYSTATRGPKLAFPTCKDWIQWVVDTLESEAKKAGKL